MIKEIKRTLLHVPSFLEFLTIIFMIYSIIVFEVLCIKYLLKDLVAMSCYNSIHEFNSRYELQILLQPIHDTLPFDEN